METLKIAVVGSRDYPRLEQVREYVRSLPFGTTVISGHAKGVDQVAEETALLRHLEVISLPAEWDKYGKSAGMIRNREIVAQADLIAVFWDGMSKGTLNSISLARKMNKSLEIYYSYGRIERERC